MDSKLFEGLSLRNRQAAIEKGRRVTFADKLSAAWRHNRQAAAGEAARPPAPKEIAEEVVSLPFADKLAAAWRHNRQADFGEIVKVLEVLELMEANYQGEER